MSISASRLERIKTNTAYKDGRMIIKKRNGQKKKKGVGSIYACGCKV